MFVELDIDTHTRAHTPTHTHTASIQTLLGVDASRVWLICTTPSILGRETERGFSRSCTTHISEMFKGPVLGKDIYFSYNENKDKLRGNQREFFASYVLG